MKECPKCGTSYTDDTLSFCLSDGTPLPDNIQNAKTEILPSGLLNFETNDSLSTQTKVSSHTTEETIVRSAQANNRHSVSPFWILATFGLLGIVLAGFVVGWLFISNRDKPADKMTVKNENTNLTKNSEASTSSNKTPENQLTPTPTSKPTSTPNKNSYRIVGVKNNDVLYIRPSAGNLKSIVGKIPPGATGIQVIGKGKKVGKSIWVLITYKGKRGWVNRRYLSKAQ